MHCPRTSTNRSDVFRSATSLRRPLREGRRTFSQASGRMPEWETGILNLCRASRSARSLVAGSGKVRRASKQRNVIAEVWTAGQSSQIGSTSEISTEASTSQPYRQDASQIEEGSEVEVASGIDDSSEDGESTEVACESVSRKARKRPVKSSSDDELECHSSPALLQPARKRRRITRRDDRSIEL